MPKGGKINLIKITNNSKQDKAAVRGSNHVVSQPIIVPPDTQQGVIQVRHITQTNHERTAGGYNDRLGPLPSQLVTPPPPSKTEMRTNNNGNKRSSKNLSDSPGARGSKNLDHSPGARGSKLYSGSKNNLHNGKSRAPEPETTTIPSTQLPPEKPKQVILPLEKPKYVMLPLGKIQICNVAQMCNFASRKLKYVMLPLGKT